MSLNKNIIYSLIILVILILQGISYISVNSAGSITRGVTIVNSLGSAQTNYPIEIVLNTAAEVTAGNMRSDCGDIRALAADLVTNLAYAFLNCNTTYTSIVVLVPSLPASSTTIINITYKDPIATTTQNPTGVFDKYEMFTAAPTCTFSGTVPVWNATNNYLVLTSATAANANGACNYTYPAPATTIKGYKAWFDIFTTTAAGSTPAGTTNAGQAIWQYAYDSAVPTNEDVTSGGGHFTFDEGNSRKCYTRATASGAACVTANGAGGSVSDTTLGNGTWRNMRVTHDPVSTTKRIFQNSALIVNTNSGTAVTTTNTNFGFGGRRSSTRAREHRVRNFAVMRFSDSITAQFSNTTITANFSLRNNTDTSPFTNSCNFGDLSVSSVASCQYRLKFESSAANGYSIQVKTSGSLTNGSNIITNAAVGAGGTGGSIPTPGVEAYGVIISPGSCTNGVTTLANQFNGTPGNLVSFNYPSATTVMSCTSQNTPGSVDTINTVLVDQRVAISSNTPAGIYNQTVIWTVVPNY